MQATWWRNSKLVSEAGRKWIRKDVRLTNRQSLLAELKASSSTGNLERGKLVHAKAKEFGNDIFVATALVNMYARCGSMVEARQVFDGIKYPDVVSWNALILGYADNWEGATALDLFARMRSQGYAPNSVTFLAALKACTSFANQNESECLVRGKQIHLEIRSHLNTVLENTLIDMYAKCGSMVDARQVFDGMMHRNVVSWTALILGYVENGEGVTALDFFSKMKSQGCAPNFVTFVAAIKACSSLILEDGSGRDDCLQRGKQIHSEINCHMDIKVQSTLIDMYSKCGSMSEARQVFDGNNRPDVVLWNALILGYAENGHGVTALNLFARMKSEGSTLNSVTFIAALKGCTSLALERDEIGKIECREYGKQIHSEIGCHLTTYVQTTLIDMYAKCRTMVDARQVFDDMEQPLVVSWNAIISGYAENGEAITALDMFAKMKSQGCAPNFITFLAALKACTLLGALESGKEIHAEINIGTDHNATILLNSLLNFYAKSGHLVEAHQVFDSYPTARNLITWNALMAGYSRLGDSRAVFELFERMQDSGIQPDSFTFVCILMCCSHSGLLGEANEYFEHMSTNYGIIPSVEHYTCMIDILGRSNKMDDAIALLRSMPCRPNAVTWMTILGASHKWENVDIGRLAFKSLVSLDYTNAGAYVLMALIYASRGMYEEQELVIEMREKFNA